MQTSIRIRGDQYQSELQVGQKVHCMLNGGRHGIICAIKGEQRPQSIITLGGGAVVMGGGCYFDIAFESHISRRLPECILRGVQWHIYDDEPLSDAEIVRAVQMSEASESESKNIAKAKEYRRANEREHWPSKYPYLETMENTKKRSHALGAANIRKELKKAFPGLTFSVRSRSYNGGNNINIGWHFGPTTKQVEEITGKYQHGNFDGMSDCYNFNHDNTFADVFGGAYYVFENRSYNTTGADWFENSIYGILGHILCDMQDVEYRGEQTMNVSGDGDDRDLLQYVRQILQDTVFPLGKWSIVGLEWSDDPDITGCYTVVFDTP